MVELLIDNLFLFLNLKSTSREEQSKTMDTLFMNVKAKLAVSHNPISFPSTHNFHLNQQASLVCYSLFDYVIHHNIMKTMCIYNDTVNVMIKHKQHITNYTRQYDDSTIEKAHFFFKTELTRSCKCCSTHNYHN